MTRLKLTIEEAEAISARNRAAWSGHQSGKTVALEQRVEQAEKAAKRVRRAAAAPVPLETDECKAFCGWTELVQFRGRPLWDRVVKIPNERGKSGAHIAVLESIGMRKGFFDYVILAPIWPGAFSARGWAGLFIEAKRVKYSETSADQYAWRDLLIEFGYHAVICEGAEQMIEATRRYFVEGGCAADGSWIDRTLA